MNNKYIIRNCPCYDGNGDEYDCGWEYSKELYCQDCTDCVLKQIVGKCRGELGRVRTIGKDIMAEEILKLLDIEECEND